MTGRQKRRRVLLIIFKHLNSYKDEDYKDVLDRMSGGVYFFAGVCRLQ